MYQSTDKYKVFRFLTLIQGTYCRDNLQQTDLKALEHLRQNSFFYTPKPKKRQTSKDVCRRRFPRSIFILPMCQNRHTSSSLGQFLFYRRVRTVTRHHRWKTYNLSFNIIIIKTILFVKSFDYMYYMQWFYKNLHTINNFT